MDHFLHDHRRHQSYNLQQPNSSGLTRYQSAPSSYFSSFLDTRDFCEEFLNRPSSPETERIFSRFLANSGGTTSDNVSNHQDLYTAKQDSTAKDAELPTQVNQQQEQVMASMNDSDSRLHQQQQQQQRSSYQSTASQSFYEDHNQSTLPLADQNSGSGMDYKAVTSMGMGRLPQMRTAGGNNSNLVRHSSSPAGLFSNLNSEIENGYAVLRGMGDLGAGNMEKSFSAASRPPCCSGRMSPTPQIGNKTTAENGMDNDGFGDARDNNYVTGFTLGSWDDSATIFVGAKGLTDDSRTLSGLDTCETQNLETGNRPPMLAHRLSLPKSTAEISAIENFLQFQDSVPCKIRAKRGCATHPRSIAERVRRTRISERMRKLQDLVPYMDKQTNTADMLDLAVDYIKDLQRQVKVLSENRGKCSCTIKQQE